MKAVVVNYPGGGTSYEDWVKGRGEGKNLSDQLNEVTRGKNVAAIAPVAHHEGLTIAFVVIIDE